MCAIFAPRASLCGANIAVRSILVRKLFFIFVCRLEFTIIRFANENSNLLGLRPARLLRKLLGLRPVRVTVLDAAAI